MPQKGLEARHERRQPALDAQQAGELLSVPKSWVMEQARHGRIPAIKLGRYWRFDRDELLAWARRRQTGPAKSSPDRFHEMAKSSPDQVSDWTPLRGYVSWSPYSKNRAVLANIRDVLEEYASYLPLTIRQIFYRLVATYEYAKTDAAYRSLVTLLGRARRARLIAFQNIRDYGISMIERTYFDSPEDFWDDTGQRLRRYRRDRQASQEQYIELWCESAGMLPQSARVAKDIRYPCTRPEASRASRACA